MAFENWHIWLLAMMVFVVFEIVIPSFVMASIGLGCFFAFLGAAVHLPFPFQMVLFILGTTTGFLGIKPLMEKYAYRKKSIHTNASGLIGRIGKVIETIDEEAGSGCVAIDGDMWKAIHTDGNIVQTHVKVKVLKVDSIVLTVEELETEHHHEVEKIPENKTQKLKIKVGNRTYFIDYDEIKGVYSNNKITYLVASADKKYIHDYSLEILSRLLPSEMFFRANRQFIVNRDTISATNPANNGKILVTLQPESGLPKHISVSRLKAHAFRQWLK